MKLRKLIIWFLIVPITVLITAGAVIPYLFYKNQESVTQMVIAGLNEDFTGELTIEKSYISPFKNFPYISIDLNHVRFYGKKGQSEKKLKPIYEIEDMYVGFDIWDILKGQYNVKQLKIEGGHLDLVKHPNGDINLLLAKKDHSADTSVVDTAAFHLDLKKADIHNFHVSYLDESDGKHLEFELNDTEAAFKIAPNHIYTFLDAKFIFSVISGDDSSFFSNKHFELHTTLDYHPEEEMLFISPSKIKLEKALFAFDGSIDMKDSLLADIRIKGEKPDFNMFIAFAPENIAEELERYKNEGNIYFNAIIKGKLASETLPYIEADFGCSKAYFLNPAINKKVDQLGLKGHFTNGTKHTLETMQLTLFDIYAQPDKGIFKGNVVIKNFDDPHISMNVHSDLDLKFIGEFFGLKGLQHIEGQVILDMNFNELVDMEVPENNLVKLKEGINSDLTIKNLSFKLPGYPQPVKDMNVHAQMRQGEVEIDRLSLKIGNSDIYLDGWLNDLPAIFHHEHKPIKIKMNARSKKIVFRELLAYDTSLAKKTDEEVKDFNIKLAFESTVDNLTSFKGLPKGEFFIEDFYAKLKHYPHTFHDFHADLIIKENTLSLKDFSGVIDQTDFHFSGALSNYALWFDDVKKGDTRFEFNLVSHQMKLHDLLSYQGENYLPEDYRHEEIKELKIHGEVDLFYDKLFRSADLKMDKLEGKLKVHPLKFEQFKGRIHYEDEHLLVENLSGIMGKSNFNVNMALYTGKDSKIKKRDNYFNITSDFLDVDQLINYNENEKIDHEKVFNIFEVPFTDMKMKADIGKMNYHKLWFKNLKADFRMQENHYLYVDSLSMKAAKGNVKVKGYFNGSNPKLIYFKSEIALDRVNLDKLMLKLDNFGQDYMVSSNLHGEMSGTITSTMHVHPDLTPILSDSKAHLDIEIVNGSLVKFAPIHAMADYFQDKNLDLIRFDTLRNKLDLDKGVLFIPAMNINSSLGFIEISGKQSLEMVMEYYVSIPFSLVTQVGFKTLFGNKNRDEVTPDQVDAIVYRDKDKRVRFLNVKIWGTPDDYKFSLGKNKS